VDGKFLIDLNLSANRFEGSIPSSFYALAKLRRLDLAYNQQLSASIQEFQPLQSLQGLMLDTNNIQGTLGSWVATSWPKLELLDVSNNRLEGELPVELFQHSNLRVLNLQSNQLSGPLQLPSVDDTGVASLLFFVALQQNSLDTSIPTEIGLLSHLQHLGKWDDPPLAL
jgi:Leucine rich repeat